MNESYTTPVLANALPGNLLPPVGTELGDTSGVETQLSQLFEYPHLALPAYSEAYREGFIGILTDEEARVMKEQISLFKKRFNVDLARRHKILFGE